MKAEDLEPGERFIWNWQESQKPGKMSMLSDFYRALIKLITRADVQNLERLRLGFPEEVEAYNQYRLVPGWWDELEARMEDAA